MYNEIIQELSGLNQDDIIKIVLSKSKSEVKKATVRPILLKGNKKWQVEKIINNQAFHSNIEYHDLGNQVLSLLEDCGFSEIYIILMGKTISYRVSKKKKLFRNEHVTEVKDNIILSHDVPKKYILEEGMQIPPLVDLGIFDSNFRVKKPMYDKYKQINRFVEIIADEFRDYDKDELTIIEFGCGKSYLTFIIYYYFAYIKKINDKITGFDLKDDVIKHCNAVAEKYNYKNVRFISGDISKIDTYHEHSRGSNTEGHVSHVLSSRLSSRPSGWSRYGLKAMAELRAYCCSGGHVETKHVKKTEASYKVIKKLLNRVTKAYRKASNEMFHNITVLSNGNVSQLSRTLKSIRDSCYII